MRNKAPINHPWSDKLFHSMSHSSELDSFANMSIEREQWNKLWSAVNRDFMFACATLHQEEGIMFIYLGKEAPSTAINNFNYKWSWCTSILWKFNYHGLLHRYENWVNLELKPFCRLCWMKPDIQPLIGCTLREHAAGFHFFLLILHRAVGYFIFFSWF